MKSNIEEINKAFSVQAKNFESKKYHLFKKELTERIVNLTEPNKTDSVLEVAAGTCVCARAFAPFCDHVTCLDATPQMLAVGRAKSEKAGIKNISFVVGNAENLPFENEKFDIVISRLAFHHFVNPQKIMFEMARVLKTGGKLVMVDMTVHDEKLRNSVDEIERMRDPSHVKNLTIKEMNGLYEKNSLKIDMQEKMDVAVAFEEWTKLTKTPDSVKTELRDRMQCDINKTASTALRPYIENDKLYFLQPWVFTRGIK